MSCPFQEEATTRNESGDSVLEGGDERRSDMSLTGDREVWLATDGARYHLMTYGRILPGLSAHYGAA